MRRMRVGVAVCWMTSPPRRRPGWRGVGSLLLGEKVQLPW